MLTHEKIERCSNKQIVFNCGHRNTLKEYLIVIKGISLCQVTCLFSYVCSLSLSLFYFFFFFKKISAINFVLEPEVTKTASKKGKEEKNTAAKPKDQSFSFNFFLHTVSRTLHSQLNYYLVRTKGKNTYTNKVPWTNDSVGNEESHQQSDHRIMA